MVYFDAGRLGHGPLSPAVSWAIDPAFNPPGHKPARAKALLAQAGVVVPLPITITVTNAPQLVRIAQIMQAQANEAGFKVEIKQIDPTFLIAVLQQHDFDLCMSPWSGRYDPDGNMFNHLTKGGPDNFMGYDSLAMTSLLVQARSATEQQDRVALYHQAKDLLAEDAPTRLLHFDAVIQASLAKLHWRHFDCASASKHLDRGGLDQRQDRPARRQTQTNDGVRRDPGQ